MDETKLAIKITDILNNRSYLEAQYDEFDNSIVIRYGDKKFVVEIKEVG